MNKKKQRELITRILAIVVALSIGIGAFGQATGLYTIPSLGGISQAFYEIFDVVFDGDKVSTNAMNNANVYMIDVGQGSSTLISANGRNILIDAGEQASATDVLAFLEGLGIKKLDAIIATHYHSDHIGGIPAVLAKIPTKIVIAPTVPENMTPTTKSYENFLLAVMDAGLQITPAQAGKVYGLGDNATLKIIAPMNDSTEMNNYSVVCRFSYGDIDFILPGDAEKAVERELLAVGTDLEAEVYFAAHHGSYTSSIVDYIAAINPTCSAISLGEDNKYNHPSTKTLTTLNEYGPVFRTDLHGSINFATNGVDITVTTQNNQVTKLTARD